MSTKGLLNQLRADLSEYLLAHGLERSGNDFVSHCSGDETFGVLLILSAAGGTRISPRLFIVNPAVNRLIAEMERPPVTRRPQYSKYAYPLLSRTISQLSDKNDERALTKRSYVNLDEGSYSSVKADLEGCVENYVLPFFRQHCDLEVIWKLVEENWEEHKAAMPSQVLAIPLLLQREDAKSRVGRFLEGLRLEPTDVKAKILSMLHDG